ncbi:hypothetical protein SEA_CHERRYONLIM_63 [Gordonia phage CherryonLim]|uniref:Uncharacterized protein n=1 Tax=Gordonia phage CherryonLim TaxID=2652411 RepID=A0A5P8D9Z1_9CAUD|nr:hypothetical protein PP994_gp63 [Gordonia phage CherryonLim]QFP95816.1 hypothetical protein SEA_CHERRYONLIM_63 [Gordonia phage CherryonLim]
MKNEEGQSPELLVMELFERRNHSDIPAKDLWDWLVNTHGYTRRDYDRVKRVLGLPTSSYKVGRHTWYRSPWTDDDEKRHEIMRTIMIDNMRRWRREYPDFKAFLVDVKAVLKEIKPTTR